ncbi:hypothetical protein Thiowin_04136 [Thiorhodovibrio winogradskyi]|uniref:Uncharacterized protein n=1 Tax=Thiorhodovibrio winogradskyi TaxID=77007 RepID=A0ABZ0SFX4_9GAMM|nr:hypothetical protein [Thiorhodovibrio winogradskyi]
MRHGADGFLRAPRLPILDFTPPADKHKLQPGLGGGLVVVAAIPQIQGGLLDVAVSPFAAQDAVFGVGAAEDTAIEERG